ncbi:MAG: zinc carboxypeptidase, partial [Cytophagales bacterium]|nr:zinc carboxypeptidase [Cytophagales bacterium]
FNPDGLNRFASWVNVHKSQTPVADPASRELNENWPPGRTNHYWIDLNRDTHNVQHPESQGRIAKFHEWKPNILTDHHEQGSNATFFFQPGVPSRVHPLTPKKNQELTARMGTFHAKALDKIGSLYFTEENYDDFYYGKGSTYPDVQGSVGILFEQASSRGHAQETTNGVLRFPFTIRNQFVTMLSTLAAARALRTDLLNFQRDFYRDAAREGKGAATKAFVFGSKEDAARTYEMLRILRQQQVDVYKAGAPVSAGGRTYEPDWAYVVPAHQPQHRLINAMFERRTTFQDSLFYDISAFSLPLAFNMPHAELKSVPSLGEKVGMPAFPAGTVTGDTATAYAYLFPWDGYYAPRAVHELLSRGYKVRVATKPFTAALAGQPVNFDYGTILVPAGIQEGGPGPLAKLVPELARRDGLRVYALGTGATGTGIDLGSSNFAPLVHPKVMLLVGQGVNPNDAGEVWHLLDQRYQMPPVMVDVSQAGRTDFWKYNVIVMTSGNYGSLSNSTVDNLKRWIEDGGTLITMTDAVGWAIARGLANVKTKKNPVDSAAARPYASLEENTRAQDIVGAIFQLRLDRTHPLAYGYKDELIPTFRDHTLFLEKPRNPYAAPGVFTPNPLLSGYVTKTNLKQLAGSAAVVVNAIGAGKVILLTDNPNFRAFWYGTNRLFMNAIFFGKTINPAAGRVEE